MPTRKDLVVLVDQSLIDGLLQGLHQECCRLGRLATAYNPRRALPNITVSSYAARLDRHKAETVHAVASFTIRFNRRDVFTVICHWTSELIATRWARLAWRHSTTSLGRDAATRPAYHCCCGCCCCSNSRRVSSDGREWWRSGVTRLRRADVNTDASLCADEKLTCDPSYKISYDLS